MEKVQANKNIAIGSDLTCPNCKKAFKVMKMEEGILGMCEACVTALQSLSDKQPIRNSDDDEDDEGEGYDSMGGGSSISSSSADLQYQTPAVNSKNNVGGPPSNNNNTTVGLPVITYVIFFFCGSLSSFLCL